jgi:hypothetical protein
MPTAEQLMPMLKLTDIEAATAHRRIPGMDEADLKELLGEQ